MTLAACGAALLVLAGCSGGIDRRTAPTTLTTVGAGVSGPTTTALPVNTSFTGQDSAKFCALAKTYNEGFTKVGANPTPAELRVVAREGQTAISNAISAAPAEIKKDVEVLASAFTALLNELEKVNFEVAKVAPAAFSQLQSPEFQQSTTRFQAYSRTVCGLTG